MLRMSRNVYVSNTTHTPQPNARNRRTALHQALPPAMKPPCFRRRVMCRRSFIGVGARDDEPESESDEHISLRFLLKPATVPLPPPPPPPPPLPPVNASSSFRLRIFLQPPPPPPPPTTTTDDGLLLIGKRRRRPVNSDDTLPRGLATLLLYMYIYISTAIGFLLVLIQQLRSTFCNCFAENSRARTRSFYAETAATAVVVIAGWSLRTPTVPAGRATHTV